MVSKMTETLPLDVNFRSKEMMKSLVLPRGSETPSEFSKTQGTEKGNVTTHLTGCLLALDPLQRFGFGTTKNSWY